MKDILPLKKARFEGVEFPVPHDTDAYLTRLYGDWRKLPTEEQIRKAIHNPDYIKEIYPADK
jgi:lipopolysaccharide cholinephosphotransferase